MIRHLGISFCWVITLILLCNIAAVAQHYKRVSTSLNNVGYIDFDSSGIINYVNNPFRYTTYYAKSNGEPWFYLNGNTKEIRYSKSEQPIRNGDILGGSNWATLQLTDSTYVITSFHGINYMVKSGSELEVVDYSISLNAKGDASNAVVRRISKYKYLVVTTNNKIQNENLKFYIHTLDKDGIELTDSISFDSTFFKQPIQWNLPGWRRYTFGGDAVVNNNASKIYMTVGGIGRYFKFPINTSFLHARGIFEVDVTAEGKVNSGPRELYYKENYEYALDKDVFQRTVLNAITISSSNKVLYCTEASRVDYDTYDSFRVFRLEVDAKEKHPIRVEYGKHMVANLCKGPYGHIYETIEYRDGSNRKEGRIIYNPNELSSQVNASNLINPIELSDYYYINNLVPYDYMKLYHRITFDCGATVRFINKTDQSAGMDSFTWYITKEDGSMDTLIGFEPSLTFTKSGDYFYKVLGSSIDENGREYAEWFIDTLKIRIPPKPVAAFSAPDTVVCAHTEVVFTNESTTDTIHPSNGEKWVWTFGDGETVTVSRSFDSAQGDLPNVTHIYTQPGTYTVSLFYSNGFCDSTLVKNQYITVVDAPAPGFSIDNNRGCTPFTLTITDTVTVNTVKKEYNFYDGTGWQVLPLNQPQLNYTYTQSGNYWITQRLYGYTGCITQQDSVRVYVNLGFTEQDTVHLLQGSYTDHPSAEGALVINAEGVETWRSNRQDTREPIELSWSSHPAAVQYQLNRNRVNLTRVDSSQLSYTDLVSRANTFTYSITGVDSCGTSSVSGRTISPMYLTGRAQKDNSLAVVQFSPYTEQLTEQQYFLQTEENDEWQVLASLGTEVQHTDEEFLGNGNVTLSGVEGWTRLEKCYRVANQTGQLSNVLCLPYTPTIFMPTAFTPNGDGLNDVFKPVTYGIQTYEVTIYNRWGQQVAKFTEKEVGWQAKAMPMGAYKVSVSALDNQGYRHHSSSTVTVLR